VIDRHARERLKRHLIASNHWYWPQPAMVAGVLLLISILFYMQHAWTLFLCAVVCGGSGALEYFRRELFVASQKEFDRIAEEDFKNAHNFALARFELKPEELAHSEPCKFRGGASNRDLGGAFTGTRVGTDEKPRRTPHEYLIVNFGRQHLFLFRCAWDLTTGTTIWEELTEFAYQDIASVSLTHKKATFKINLRTRRDIAPLWKKEGIVPINDTLQVPSDETVALSLVSGEVIELLSWKRSGLGIPSGEGKKSHQTAQRLQKLVRELKLTPAATPSPASNAAPNPSAPVTIRDVRSR
jgi:hypothetical protein